MKIAVEGCAHGELETIYAALENIQRRDNIKVDLLLCCGDFQAVRNEADLLCMAVPPKFRKMCSFYKYYNGERKAPILTIFIGGNHEASNHLWELPFGGWVAPNIYYLGYSGVVNFGGLRIAGLSGIWKGHDYNKGHFESPPFDQSTVRSIYHVRSLDVFKLKLLTRPVDIVMSHDWPKGVYHYGNLDELYRWKGFLREEIESNTLGSFAGQEVLQAIQPNFWFSAHLHCRFPAQVVHSQSGKTTNFLALDKCLPRRKYLEVIDLGEATGPLELSYDAEWLAITKSTLPLMNTEQSNTKLPFAESVIMTLKPSDEAVKEVKKLFDDNLNIPENFTQTVPLYNPAKHKKHVQVLTSTNPQTDTFCTKLKIRNPFWTTELPGDVTSENPDEISLSDDDDDDSETQSSDFSTPLPQMEGKHTLNFGPIQNAGKHEDISSETADEVCLADDEESESQSSDFLPKKNTEAKPEVDQPLSAGSDDHHVGLGQDGESKMEPDGNSDSEPPQKMFKLVRRNQTMYSTTEDSDG